MTISQVFMVISFCGSCIASGFVIEDRYVDHGENKVANVQQEKMIIAQMSDYRLETIEFQIKYLTEIKATRQLTTDEEIKLRSLESEKALIMQRRQSELQSGFF